MSALIYQTTGNLLLYSITAPVATTVTAIQVGYREVQVIWTEPSVPGTTYQVFWTGTSSGSSPTGRTRNSYTASSLIPGTYTFTVRATFHFTTDSDPSAAVLVKGDTTVPVNLLLN